MKVLVVGSGMYVSGRSTDGYGTILPALFELSKDNLISNIGVLITTQKSKELLLDKIDGLNQKMGLNIKVEIILSDLQSAINEFKPNSAIVSTPDETHFEISKVLIENSIHIQVVKPLTHLVQENIELIDLVNKFNVIGSVEYHKRYDEANLILKEQIRENKMGVINQINIDYSQRKILPEDVFRSWVEKTNIFEYLGVHYVDLIHFLTGAIPISVIATGEKNHLISKGINTYDQIITLIKWRAKDNSTFTSNHTTSWIDPNSSTAMSNQKIKVYGTKAIYESDQKDRGITFLDDGGLEHINPYFSRFYIDGENYRFDGYALKSIKSFLYSARENKKINIADFESSLIVTKVVEAVNKSLIAKGWINI